MEKSEERKGWSEQKDRRTKRTFALNERGGRRQTRDSKIGGKNETLSKNFYGKKFR
jgi:hypothetical protein